MLDNLLEKELPAKCKHEIVWWRREEIIKGEIDQLEMDIEWGRIKTIVDELQSEQHSVFSQTLKDMIENRILKIFKGKLCNIKEEFKIQEPGRN